MCFVTILILIDGFLQCEEYDISYSELKEMVTILILIDGFLQYISAYSARVLNLVTILILIDGFLQYCPISFVDCSLKGHNPYFNRWFSAIWRWSPLTGGVAASQSLF